MPDGGAEAVPPGRLAPALHITFVIAALGAGGAERVLSLITGLWAEHRHVTVIAFDTIDDAIFHPLDPRVKVIRLGVASGGGRRGISIFAALHRVLVLRRALQTLDPDLVISFLTKINVLTLLASLGTRRRVIISERNNPQMQQANSIWNTLLAKLNWRAAGIVMQTHGSLTCLDERARARAVVISNPIEVPPPCEDGSGRRVLAAVGRLTPQKGFDLLIEAFAGIADLHPDWTLRIWGEGELRGTLERQIARLGLQGRVDLPGNSGGPAEWTCYAEAFVFSSRYEGFGNALAEAAAAGLPVVSFDCPFGPSDIIDPERTGLLVPPGNVRALSAALDRLLGDEELRRRLGRQARAEMSRFDLPTVMARWDAVVDRALRTE
jgi:glycosyltransferase involved in cell wall biosynthesis